MADKKQSEARIKEFVEKASIIPLRTYAGISNRSGYLEKRKVEIIKTAKGEMEILKLAVSKAIYVPPIFTKRKTDGELEDEEWQGKDCYYEVFFLTGYSYWLTTQF